jgi:3-hydroxyacyl-[acyl-carrier-protein] dehydratase
MNVELDVVVAADWARARKVPLWDEESRVAGPALGQTEIESLLPQRSPFLFVDEVVALDEELGLVATRYNPARWPEVLDAHFPGQPMWPGVLQIEAVGQAGLLLTRRRHGTRAIAVLAEVMRSAFLRPILPGDGDVTVVARVVEDGFFFLVVGQCLCNGVVCSASMLRGTFVEE